MPPEEDQVEATPEAAVTATETPGVAVDETVDDAEMDIGEVPSTPKKEKDTVQETDDDSPYLRDPLFPPWTKFTLFLNRYITLGITSIALSAAKRPYTYLISLTILSFALVAVGYFTGFELELDIAQVLTPLGSRPLQHSSWITVGFPDDTRDISMIFYNNGENVMHVSQTRRVFEAIEAVRTTPGFEELCAKGSYLNVNNENTCRIVSASGYWKDHNITLFDESAKTDLDIRLKMSALEMADGSPMLRDLILGNWEASNLPLYNESTLLESAESYLVRVSLPNNEKLRDETDDVETEVLERLSDLRDSWIKIDASGDRPENTLLSVDIVSIYAYQLEAMRAVIGDIYLVAMCCVIMVGFTMIVFYRKEEPRCLLGLCSVITICMSMLTGMGLMFVCRVPYSMIHQMIYFLIFGIGLDDTFIITGAFFRTSRKDSMQERIRKTMHESGWSISVTTISTSVAFILGYASSSFRGVRWLCLYAFTIIIVDFFYQITYFVAFMVLDEYRQEKKRIENRDSRWWCCRTKDEDDDDKLEDELQKARGGDDTKDDVKEEAKDDAKDGTKDEPNGTSDNKEDHNDQSKEDKPKNRKRSVMFSFIGQDSPNATKEESFRIRGSVAQRLQNMYGEGHTTRKSVAIRLQDWYEEQTKTKPLADQIMEAYGRFLLKWPVRIVVLVVFALFFAACCYSATFLKQEFNVADYVPQDSYLKSAFDSVEKYSSVVSPINVYFRDIDQTDPEMHKQMIAFVEELESLPQIGNNGISANASVDAIGATDQIRNFCWVRDMQLLTDPSLNEDPELEQILDILNDMTFLERLEFALSQGAVREVYGQDIVRDETGNITASRCTLFLRNLDLKDVEEQIDMLEDQRAVASKQPINQGKSDWSFFCFDEIFFYWEAYSVAVQELIFTMIAGFIAVTLISFVFMPHYTGALIIGPMIAILYVNLLGSFQVLGLYINGLTYVCVVVAIGLLIDFLVHILLRYYETVDGTREEKVLETLETMGASLLLGGLTTFLGAVPLAISKLQIFSTVFKAFFAMIALGTTHGLILLPVILSICGPTKCVRGHFHDGLASDASPEGAPTLEDEAKLSTPTRSPSVKTDVSPGESPLLEVPERPERRYTARRSSVALRKSMYWV